MSRADRLRVGQSVTVRTKDYGIVQAKVMFVGEHVASLMFPNHPTLHDDYGGAKGCFRTLYVAALRSCMVRA